MRKLSDGVFRVEGGQVERMVIQTDWENEDAIAFLQHRFKAVDRFIHIPAPFYAPGRTAVKNRRGKRKMISPLRCAG